MKRLGAVFSGQGSHYVGMGKELCENIEIAKDTFLMANDILKFDLMKLCFEGDEEKLRRTEFSQPAILTYSVALYKAFESEFGIKPRIFAGHSLGEYSALTCAGVVSFENALKIVKRRGELMGSVPSGGSMAAIIGADADEIREYCRENCETNAVLSVSNYNTEQQTVISGDSRLVQTAANYFGEGFGAKILNVSGAFHSPMMDKITDEFKSELKKYSFLMPKYRVISDIDGMPFADDIDIKEKLVNQLVNPVKWTDVMDYFVRDQIDTVIEFGPGKTLKNFFKAASKKIQPFSFEQNDDYLAICVLLRSPEYQTEQLKEFVDQCLCIIACTKNSNFNQNMYKKDVIDVCKEIRNIDVQGSLLEVADRALDLTIAAINGKHVPIGEKAWRLSKLETKTSNMELQKLVNSRINHL